MKKTLLLAVLAGILFTQCGKDQDSFAIKNGMVGPLTKRVQMKQLDSIFAQDSIVKLNAIENALGTQGEVEVYEKGGKKLLLISPDDETDPNSLITNIQIFDERYTTEKGLTSKSTFKDVKANYEIANIENAINAVVVFLKNEDLYITIDKKQLPENIRYDYSSKIEVSQIPDEATFKYFMLGWDVENSSEK